MANIRDETVLCNICSINFLNIILIQKKQCANYTWLLNLEKKKKNSKKPLTISACSEHVCLVTKFYNKTTNKQNWDTLKTKFSTKAKGMVWSIYKRESISYTAIGYQQNTHYPILSSLHRRAQSREIIKCLESNIIINFSICRLIKACEQKHLQCYEENNGSLLQSTIRELLITGTKYIIYCTNTILFWVQNKGMFDTTTLQVQVKQTHCYTSVQSAKQ